MTALPDTLAAHVAEGLSERQREALLWLPQDENKKYFAHDWECRQLKETANFEIASDVYADLATDECDDGDYFWKLTPFGVRVRALVAKEAGDE